MIFYEWELLLLILLLILLYSNIQCALGWLIEVINRLELREPDLDLSGNNFGVFIFTNKTIKINK